MRTQPANPAINHSADTKQSLSWKRLVQRSTYPLPIAIAGALAILFLFGWGPNFCLALTSVVVLLFGSWLCWRPGEPAVLLYIFLFQWIQASILILSANFNGIPIDAMAELSRSNMERATYLTLFGLLTIVCGFRLASGPSRTSVVQRAAEQVEGLKLPKLISAYVASILGAIVLNYFASLAEGLRQPALALLSFKNAIFFIVAYVGFRRGGVFKNFFFIAFSFEILSSLGSYFSSFQSVFAYTFIAMLAAGLRFRPAQFFGVGVLAATAIFFAVVWSAVKVDYRLYLNGGSGQQEITVGYTDAVSTLAELVRSVDLPQLADGADALVRRMAYVEFFGATLNYVPAVVPHTDGKLWGDAVLHPLAPRLFFPNKPVIDASAQTRMYTGIRVAGRESGAQISMGYMAESYVDFGTWGMFFALATYGAMLGFLYRKVLSLRKFGALLSMGLCVPLVSGNSYLNAEAIKMVGYVSVTAITIFVVHAVGGDKIRILLFGNFRVGRSRKSIGLRKVDTVEPTRGKPQARPNLREGG